ncbi:hypothetical protein [Celeribacter marinus]|uniref:hypothetical protein n=1 Tax=Celeribacter marinus TaxID=1397108 RepID=UPI003175FC1B
MCWSDIQFSDDLMQPSSYLLDAAVSKEVGSKRLMEHRAPVPELLYGHPTIFQGALATLQLKMKYRVTTLSFHEDDIDVAAFNSGDGGLRKQVAIAVEMFLETAFAGVPNEARPPCLVTTHSHLGRLEVNVAMPRFVRCPRGTVRSINPHPNQKGSQKLWDALRDALNMTFGWRGPHQDNTGHILRGPNWAEKKIAAAQRHGVEFDGRRDPKLVLLHHAKRFVDGPADGRLSPRQETFSGLATRLGFRISLRGGNKLWVTDKTGLNGFTIREKSRDETQEIQQTITETIAQFDTLWTRRARNNAKDLLRGDWCEPAPNWRERLTKPLHPLPVAHPDFLEPRPSSSDRNLSLGARLQTRLQSLAAMVGRMIAHQSILYALCKIDLSAFRKITEKLENITYDQTSDSAAHRNSDDRTLQPFATSPRARRGRGDIEKSRRVAHGVGTDQNGDGAAREVAGRFGAQDPRLRIHREASGRSRDETGHDRHECWLDLSDPRSAGISKGELIRSVMILLRDWVPSKPFALQMCDSGSLSFLCGNLTGEVKPDGRVVLSGDHSDVRKMNVGLARAFSLHSVPTATEYDNVPGF